jgi:hypothetical protein
MRAVVILVIVFSFADAFAELQLQTQPVRGSAPYSSNNIGVFNYSERHWPPKVGSDLRHYSLAPTDDDGDAISSSKVQWLADGQPIPGATGSAYKPVQSDIGKVISLRITISTDPARTDPYEGVYYTFGLPPVRDGVTPYSPTPLYYVSGIAKPQSDAQTTCENNGHRLATESELKKVYTQSTSSTVVPGAANDEMCSLWGWGLDGACGGGTDVYWSSGSNGVNMRTGASVSGSGQLFAVACFKNHDNQNE